MKTRTLPGTDLEVSEACLGTMTWGEQNSEAEAHAQIDRAIARGVNFIDTAEMYPVPPNATTQGRTESLPRQLAREARPRRASSSRPRSPAPGAATWIRDGRTDLTRETIAEAVGTSLARLQARLHRPLPDPLAAAERAAVRRDRVRPGARSATGRRSASRCSAWRR